MSPKAKAEKSDPNKNDIAIIGMACRFPGANDYNEFWENLKNGVNSIKEIPPERWDVNKYYSPDISEPNKSISKWCGLADEIDRFDNEFFNISPREAEKMDPQHRLLLEEAWRCVEDSGVPLKKLREKKAAVFVGVATSDYIQHAYLQGTDIDAYSLTGNYHSTLGARISYMLAREWGQTLISDLPETFNH